MLGLALVPGLLAKLWSVIPKLFVWPPWRSVASLLERLSLVLVVGGVIFEMTTGMLNIEYHEPISFYTGHFYGAWAFMAGFAIHICVKFGEMIRALRSRRFRTELRTGLADTVPEAVDDDLVATEPAVPTISSSPGGTPRRSESITAAQGAFPALVNRFRRPTAAGPPPLLGLPPAPVSPPGPKRIWRPRPGTQMGCPTGWVGYATAMMCRALWIPRKSDSLRVTNGIPRATATAAMRMSKRRGFGSRPAARTFAHRAPQTRAALVSNGIGAKVSTIQWYRCSRAALRSGSGVCSP